MAFLHKVQFIWFMVLIFIILLTLKLDGKINEWDWFIIFIPMWILDTVIIAFTLINMVMHCRNKWWHNTRETSLKRKSWCLTGIILKLVFQILLCLKLQYYGELRVYQIMVPVWLFLSGCTIDLFTSLLAIAKRAV